MADTAPILKWQHHRQSKNNAFVRFTPIICLFYTVAIYQIACIFVEPK
jgi:hypothetical protein